MVNHNITYHYKTQMYQQAFGYHTAEYYKYAETYQKWVSRLWHRQARNTQRLVTYDGHEIMQDF